MTKRVGCDPSTRRLPACWAVQAPPGFAGEVDVPGVEFDEEQYVEAAQQDRVDAEESVATMAVACEAMNAVDERRPRRARPVGNLRSSGVAQDLPDGGGGEAMAELVQFSVDAPVTRRRVLVCEA